jgi:hypothetical protein
MTSPCSSGSSRVDSALDPTMSQNMMVSWRHSAGDAGVDGGIARGAADGLLEARPAPHSEQNRAWTELACPQARHTRGSSEPQCSQNLLSSFRLALQLGHCIAAPPIALGQRQRSSGDVFLAFCRAAAPIIRCLLLAQGCRLRQCRNSVSCRGLYRRVSVCWKRQKMTRSGPGSVCYCATQHLGQTCSGATPKPKCAMDIERHARPMALSALKHAHWIDTH